MFEPIKFQQYSEDGDQVFEIKGRNIVWDEISELFYSKYDSSNVYHIRIAAVQQIILNEDLSFPGKNLSLIAPIVGVPNRVTCDLSGEDATPVPRHQKPAQNGVATGENGEDGEDGIAGGSSGNLAICTSEIVNKNNLNVILNGGDGTQGQDGGNGAAGENGIGLKFDDVFGFGSSFGAIYMSFSNTIAGGTLGRALGGFTKKVRSDGITYQLSSSTYYWSTHLMEFYEGTKGQRGGNGGTNGNGGEGGKKGTCTIGGQGGQQIKLPKVFYFS